MRTKVVDKVIAERKAVGKERQIHVLESKSLLSSCERLHGKLEDREFSSRDDLSWRCEQFEAGGYLAERPTDVVSHELADDDKAERHPGLLVRPRNKEAAGNHKKAIKAKRG